VIALEPPGYKKMILNMAHLWMIYILLDQLNMVMFHGHSKKRGAVQGFKRHPQHLLAEE